MAQSEFINYFFRDRLSNTGVVCFLLFLMVTVWAYCVRQLCLHNDDPVRFHPEPEGTTRPFLLSQKAPRDGRLYLDKLQSADETSSLT